MYAELGVTEEPFTETAVGQMRIRAYWNTGLVAVRRSAGPVRRLGGGARAPVRCRDRPEALAAVHGPAELGEHDHNVPERVRVLSHAYNYPLRHRQALVPAASDLDLPAIVHLHYRLSFHVPDALGAPDPPFDPSGDRYRWLADRLPIEPIVDREE